MRKGVREQSRKEDREKGREKGRRNVDLQIKTLKPTSSHSFGGFLVFSYNRKQSGL